MVAQIVRAFQPISTSEIAYIIGAWSLSGGISFLTIFLPSSFGISEISLALLLARILSPVEAGTIVIVVRVLVTAYEVLSALLLYPLIRQTRLQANGEEVRAD